MEKVRNETGNRKMKWKRNLFMKGKVKGKGKGNFNFNGLGKGKEILNVLKEMKE